MNLRDAHCLRLLCKRLRGEQKGEVAVAPMWQLRVSQTNMRTERERESEEGRQVQSEMASDSEMIKAAI